MRGFTLIELSIVLVIIGLIVGGILTGQDLIRAAGVRAQISQIEKYQTAANTFRGKYGYLPGDIKDPDASRFGFPPRGTQAATGDGNGVLGGISSLGSGPANDCYAYPTGETAMFWVDLSIAHLIDGGFSTAQSAVAPTVNPLLATTTPSISSFLPSAKIGNGNYIYVYSGGWQAGGAGCPGDSTNYFGLSLIQYFYANLGIETPIGPTAGIKGGLTVQQAYSIDAKTDDGLPQSGGVTAVVLYQSPGWMGDSDPTTGGPVHTGDGVATSGPNQSVSTTCYDNNASAGAVETYSMGNANIPNCALSFRFQ